MIHHMGVFASDHAASRRFYRAALWPLGIILGYESDGVSEFWHRDADTPSLSLERTDGLCTQDLHVAFAADDRDAVDAFFCQGVAAGGTQRHAPRYWPEYRAYCAFLNDRDGTTSRRSTRNGESRLSTIPERFRTAGLHVTPGIGDIVPEHDSPLGSDGAVAGFAGGMAA